MDTYTRLREEFSWDQAWEQFDGNFDRFNLGQEVVGKHNTEKTAVRIVDFDTDTVEEISFRSLKERANQFSSFLNDLGLTKGDRVAAIMDHRPELYTTIVGTWLGGFVYIPLYTLFGPKAINYRLSDSDANVIVTDLEHVDKIDQETVEDIIVVDADKVDAEKHKKFSEIYEYDSNHQISQTSADDLSTIVYTSGTTGSPSPIKHFHLKLVSLYPYMEYAVGLEETDNYFSTASAAWSYGLFESTAYTLHRGTGLTTYRGHFDTDSFIDVLEEYEITNMFTSPTVFRKLAQADADLESKSFKLDTISCAGEPLDSETFQWVNRTFGTKILNHYGFTESVAGLVVNNYPFEDWQIKPGSMGKPLPGAEVEVFDLQNNQPVDTDTVGELTLLQKPPMAKENPKMSEEAREKFSNDWLRSGDLVRVDEDGYFWFEGRKDDVIISAGYRIGPHEVEEALMQQEEVAETAVVGLPDPERGEIVAAFIILADGYDPTPELAAKLQGNVKQRLSKHEYPRRIEFVEELPKTESGKIQRNKLREEYS